MEQADRFDTLVDILDRLRSPGGCPWDREQTYESLRGYLIEECYEVAETLDRQDPSGLREELGDLLLQIVFLSRLAKEDGHFEARDVVRGIVEKMVRRHPHVFGDETAEDAEAVLRKWEQIKRREKLHGANEREDDSSPRPSVLDGIPRALPALLKAQRLGTKAARVGFDWRRTTDVLDKVEEELGELRRAVGREDRAAVREEIGDLLFSVAMVARRMEIDPEGALERANLKFTDRFTRVERELRRRRVPVEEAGLELLDELWNRTKGP